MFSKAFKITLANKILCYKTFVFRAIIILLAVISGYLVAKSYLSFLFESVEFKAVVVTLKSYVSKIFSVDSLDDFKTSGASEDIRNAVSNFLSFIFDNFGELVGVIVAILIISIIVTFLFGVFDYVVGVLINEHMSSLNHAPFFNTLFENFSKSMNYALYRMIMLFAYNTISVLLVYLIGLLFIKLLGLFAIPLIVLLFVFFVAIRQTFAGLTLSIMVLENKGAFSSFKQTFVESVKNVRTDKLKERFIMYFATCIMTFSISSALSVASMGISYVVTIPTIAVMFSVIKFVNYYELKQKKYYITYDQIIIPKELRKNDEILLNQVEI